jgi:hypothetical protein
MRWWFVLAALVGCGDDVASTMDAAAGSGGSAGAAGHGGSGGSAGAAGMGTGGSGGGAGSFCTNPVFTTSDAVGLWSDGGYWVMNNKWNAANYPVTQTLYACSFHNWYVVANMNNNSGDGAVKTYPNVHKDFNDVPLSGFNSITSTFAETSPHVGIYDVAFDIWINGVASSGSTEIMIWNENYNQVPSGSRAATPTLGGRAYDVYKTSNNGYIAFIPRLPFTSGTVDLLEIFRWVITQGWMPSNSTLGAIDLGVEIVSTNSADATFAFTDFSITTN